MDALIGLTLFPVTCFAYAIYHSVKSSREYHEELRRKNAREYEEELVRRRLEAAAPKVSYLPADPLPTTADGWARRLETDLAETNRFIEMENDDAYRDGYRDDRYDAAVADARIADGIHDARQRGYRGTAHPDGSIAYQDGRYYGYWDARARLPTYASVPAERYPDDPYLRSAFVEGYDDGYAEGWPSAISARS